MEDSYVCEGYEDLADILGGFGGEQSGFGEGEQADEDDVGEFT